MAYVKQKFAGTYAQDRRRSPEACGSLAPVPPETPTPRTSGLGVVLSHIRSGDAVTRATLAQRTGLARSTIAQRVDVLLESGLIYEAGDSVSTGGRRPGLLAFNPRAGVVLTADLGATHSRFAITDLAGVPLAEQAHDLVIAEGPETVLEFVHERFLEVLATAGGGAAEVVGIGIGIPGPVEFGSGRPVSPPIMPGWDGVDIPGWWAARYPEVPVVVDNDVNIMALGEHWEAWRDVEHMLYVKVGTGIGCGIVSDGRIHRGAEGAAGDIGHIVVSDADDVVCRCGNTGCLEAVAGGHALAGRLATVGRGTATSRDVVQLVLDGDPVAVRMVRDAGRALGEVLAACVNFFNPRVIVVGGDIGTVHEQLLAGLREVVIQRSLPLATRDLRIVTSRLGDRAGVVGGAIMVIERLLAPGALERSLLARAGRAG
jgi:predicted NBD/HSP70 family sugar kinase